MWYCLQHLGEQLTRFVSLPQVPCRFGCGVMTLGRTVKFHEGKECTKTWRTCKWGCGKSIDQREPLTHEESECLVTKIDVELLITHLMARASLARTHTQKRELTCEACHDTVLAGDMKEHKASTCRERVTLCTHGCGKMIHGRDLDSVSDAVIDMLP